MVGWMLMALGAWLALASGVTLTLFGVDKGAAVNGRRRVRERTLLAMALVGGWPGALVGQRVFRHKTIDRAFRTGLALAIAGNVLAIGLIAWLVVTRGARAG